MNQVGSDFMENDADLPPRGGDQRELLSRKMAALLRITRLSDRLIYERTTNLLEFEWRMIMRLGFHGPSLVWELAHLLDVDRAQASRAASQLTDLGLVARQGSRGALKLSATGSEMYGVLRRLSLARNALLTANLSTEQRSNFEFVLMRFHENVHHLFDGGERQEELLDRRAKLRGDIYPQADIAEGGEFETNELVVVPAVLLVLRAIRRNILPAFKELSGLSEIEWIVLAWVSGPNGMPLQQLVANMERDKSQVGRAVKRLIERGLIASANSSPRAVLLRTLPAGDETYVRIAAEADRHEQLYLAGISDAQAGMFRSSLSLMIENALRLLAYDRATAGASPLAA